MATFAVLVMVRAGVNGTVTVQEALPVPGGQSTAAAAETAVLVMTLPPVSGLSTVTE